MTDIHLSCVVRSGIIDNLDDARAYYAIRYAARDHRVEFKSNSIRVHFNAEEIHLFTDERTPCPPDCVAHRPGARYSEVRCFSLERARWMDSILPTIARPTTALAAKIPGGVQLYGPPDSAAVRLSVVVAPRGAGGYFVRTVFRVDAKAYVQALRSTRRVQWPPK